MSRVYKKYRSSLAYVLICFLTLFSNSYIPTRADEGVVLQDDENGNAITTFITSNPSGLALVGGRRVLGNSVPAEQWQNVGFLKVFDVSSGVGYDTFASAGDTNNINVSTAPPDAGVAYLDLANSNKETLCASAVWSTSDSAWWVACRALNSSNKYLLYILKVTTSGSITSYSTTLGGTTNGNQNAYLGRHGSLLLDGSDLVMVGYRGISQSHATYKLKPFIAKFALSSAGNSWAPSYLVDFTDKDADATNYRAVAVVDDGSNYYVPYTHLTTGGLKVAKYGASTLSASATSGFFSTITFPSATVGSTPTVWPTSMEISGNNVYVGGSVRSGNTSAYYGFIYALNKSTAAAVTTCDTDGFNLFQINSNKDTQLNSLNLCSSASSLMLSGANYTGTNYKGWVGKVSVASSACSFDNSYGTGGVYAHSELDSDVRYLDGEIDSSTGKFLVAGQAVTVSFNGVFRPANFIRSFNSCTSTSLRNYVTACSMNWDGITSLDHNQTVTPGVTFTWSNSTTTSSGLSKLACTTTGGIGSKSGSPKNNFTATAADNATSGTISCKYTKKIDCGSANITVATATTTTTSTMAPESDLQCLDDLDNDSDGQFDCWDDGCYYSGFCYDGPPPTTTTTVETTTTTVETTTTTEETTTTTEETTTTTTMAVPELLTGAIEFGTNGTINPPNTGSYTSDSDDTVNIGTLNYNVETTAYFYSDSLCMNSLGQSISINSSGAGYWSNSMSVTVTLTEGVSTEIYAYASNGSGSDCAPLGTYLYQTTTTTTEETTTTTEETTTTTTTLVENGGACDPMDGGSECVSNNCHSGDSVCTNGSNYAGAMCTYNYDCAENNCNNTDYTCGGLNSACDGTWKNCASGLECISGSCNTTTTTTTTEETTTTTMAPPTLTGVTLTYGSGTEYGGTYSGADSSLGSYVYFDQDGTAEFFSDSNCTSTLGVSGTISGHSYHGWSIDLSSGTPQDIYIKATNSNSNYSCTYLGNFTYAGGTTTTMGGGNWTYGYNCDGNSYNYGGSWQTDQNSCYTECNNYFASCAAFDYMGYCNCTDGLAGYDMYYSGSATNIP